MTSNSNFNNIYYLYSDFIDQELSSDLADQYFVSFIFCDNMDNLKVNQNTIEIKYPIIFKEYLRKLVFLRSVLIISNLYPSLLIVIRLKSVKLLVKQILNEDGS